jgi:hypothetical protein
MREIDGACAWRATTLAPTRTCWQEYRAAWWNGQRARGQREEEEEEKVEEAVCAMPWLLPVP